MSGLILPSRFTQQPQGFTQIDWSNPLTQGLRAAVNGTLAFDYVTNKFLTVGSAGVSNTPTPLGMAHTITTASGNSYIQLPFEVSGAVTVVAILSRDASATGVDDARKIASIATNLTAGQSTFWTFNAGNGFGAGADNDKPRFSTNAAGIGTIYLNGVALSGNNPATTDLVNGKFYVAAATVASGASSSGSGATRLMGGYKGVYSMVGRMPLALLFNVGKTADEIKRISDNPWQIFQAPPRKLWVAASSGAAALAGNATAQAAATGSLTTQINIAAAAVSFATASGALTTAIPLSGVAAATAAASGALSTQIPLSGAAVSQASAGGSLTTQIRITGAALAQAVSSALLSTGITMTATAVTQAAAQGTLVTAINLLANAAAQATATASMGGGALLSANAAAQATASAALTIQIRMAASATGSAAASAALTTQIPLSAAALSEAIAIGGLTAGSTLSGSALANAGASAWLLTAVRLAADASVIAAASAALTGGSVPVLRYQALTADIFPTMLTADAFPTMLTAEVY